MLITDPTECSSETINHLLDGPAWPVSDHQLAKLASDCFRTYWQFTSECEVSEADLFLAVAPTVVSLLNLIQYNYAVSWAERSSISWRGQSREYFLAGFSNRTNFFGEKLDTRDRIAGLGRVVYTTVRQVHRFRAYPNVNVRPWQSLALGYPASYLRSEHFRKQKKFALWGDGYVMSLRSQVQLGHNVNKRMENAIVDLVSEIFRSVGDMSDGLPRDQIIAEWIRRVAGVQSLFEHVYKSQWIRCRGAKELHLFGPGNIFRKVFSLASQRAGVTVTNYLEKNTFLNIEPFGHVFEEKLWENTFCPNSAVITAREENYRRVEASRHHPQQRYFSVGSTHYQQLAEKARHESGVEKKFDVIIVGFPLVHVRYLDDPSLFFYFRLRFEIQIIRCLQSFGLSVSYSIHTERVLQGHLSLLKSLGVGVVTKPFEVGHQDARMILFTHFSTSVLGSAVASGKPIVALVNRNANLNPTAVDALYQRVAKVEYSVTEGGTVEYSTKCLQDALVSAKEMSSNTKYLDTFL